MPATIFGTQRGEIESSRYFLFILIMLNICVVMKNLPVINYVSSVDISPSESFLHQGQHPTLTVQSSGHAMHMFINGRLSGTLNCCFQKECIIGLHFVIQWVKKRKKKKKEREREREKINFYYILTVTEDLCVI